MVVKISKHPKEDEKKKIKGRARRGRKEKKQNPEKTSNGTVRAPAGTKPFQHPKCEPKTREHASGTRKAKQDSLRKCAAVATTRITKS